MGFKLSDERYEEIKEIIVDMFEKYHVPCVPININREKSDGRIK